MTEPRPFAISHDDRTLAQRLAQTTPRSAPSSIMIRNCRMVGDARVSVRIDGDAAVVDFHGSTLIGANDASEPTRANRGASLRDIIQSAGVAYADAAARAEASQLRQELDRAQARVAIGTAAGDVLLERERHPLIGWTPEHDRDHGVGHLVDLAVRRLAEDPAVGTRGDLVEAAALLLAAIDVFDWASTPSAPVEEADRG